MRLKAAVTEDRIKFLRELFAEQPELSVRKTQAVLQGKFGRTMRNATILTVRAEVLTAAKRAGTPRA